MILNSIRKIVGGPKIRTIENGYDLDLTYITNRLIAMAFPACGIQTIYRNPIEEVVEFLTQKHQENYLIINLSGRKYDYTKFNNKVLEYGWQDHQAPTIYTLFQICKKIQQFLLQNNENVVAVHCNHGKGRTGTIIVCFLLYCNFIDSVEEALVFYAKRRFNKDGYGVTQPCQIRYIKYFNQLLLHKKVELIPYNLTSIEFQGNHTLQNCYALIKCAKTKNILYRTSDQKNNQINIGESHPLLGDFYIEFIQKTMLLEKDFGRVSFNTIFIPKQNCLKFKLNEISPDNFFSKNKRIISQNFSIMLTFDKGSLCVKSSNNKKCSYCQKYQEQKMNWEKLYVILTCYQFPQKQFSLKLLYGI